MLTMMIAIGGVLTAVFFDWKIKKIPNWLTFSMMASGMAFHFWHYGFSGLMQSLLGLVLGILFLAIPFAAGGIGGGDVKLVAALGSLLGPHLIFFIFLASAVFGGVFSVIAAAGHRKFRRTFQNIKDRIFYFILTKKLFQENQTKPDRNRLHIPYAYAVGCGTFFVMIFMRGG